MVVKTPMWPEAPPRVSAGPAHKGANGYVVLDRTWAQRLGVQRTAGTYRIRRRELIERLTMLQQRPMERVLRFEEAGASTYRT